MGAVTFSLDVNLVVFLTQALSFDHFIETGTFRGDTLDIVNPYFPQCISIELSENYYQFAVSRFQQDASVTILKGDSRIVLTDIVQQLKSQAILFWLDAHWCEAKNSLGEIPQCPLLQELRAIQHLNERSVLLIDDARLYFCPPGKPHEYLQWPDFDEVLQELYSLSSRHKLVILNDVFVYYPRAIHDNFKRFAHEYGVDWRDTTVKSYEHDHLLQEVQTKEQMIQKQDLMIQKHDQVVQEKEQKIQELHLLTEEQGNIIRYLQSHPFRTLLKSLLPKPILDTMRCIRRNFQPKLGQLHQHPPEPLNIFNNHSSEAVSFNQLLPVVSIVTPSFNHAQFLERTLKSVLEQYYPNLEYLVQDGASTDKTSQILREYSQKLTHFESAQDTGQANAINRGFTHATGDIMAWLNSDDILFPGTIRYVVNFFLDHPEVDVVYGHRIIINEEDEEIGRWILPPHDKDMLLWADYVPQETLFWRRRIWEKAGGYVDESFDFALDWEMLLRFRDAGARFVRVPRFLAAFRVHEHQKTSKELEGQGFQEMHRLREHCHGRYVSHTEAHEKIRHYLRKQVLYDALHRLGILRYQA